jgi:hypothetical protein
LFIEICRAPEEDLPQHHLAKREADVHLPRHHLAKREAERCTSYNGTSIF